MALFLQDGTTRLIFTRHGDHVLISALELAKTDIRPMLLDWLNSRETCALNELNHFLDLSLSVPVSDLITLLKGFAPHVPHPED